MEILIIVGALVAAVCAVDNPAALQLEAFRTATNTSIFPLTTSAGKPVSYDEAYNSLNSNLNLNEYFLDTISHLAAENIPERIVHTKGAGAHGYFEVTQSFKNYSKAKLFDTVGKKTPVTIRIGPGIGRRADPDLARTIRGMAAKFYTEEGNLDLTTMNTPMFFFRDPLVFQNFVHANRPNPVTNIPNPNAVLDSLLLRPESLFSFLYVLSDRGIPDGYRNLDVYTIHTFQLENEKGELSFARFNFIPENGAKYINSTEAALRDRDYGSRDLYNAIENGDYPVWILYAQLATHEQVKKVGFEIFDVTRILDTDEYPLREIGRLVLNKNPNNYFADVEQIAFCPSNLVPGISGGPDTFYEGRRISYRLARNYRLGINANNIPINAPLTPSNNYLRDGVPPVNTVNYDGPNYYPNSFNGPVPLGDKPVDLIKLQEDEGITNYGQINKFYTEMSDESKETLVSNFVQFVSPCSPDIQERTVAAYAQVNTTLAESIRAGLAAAAAAATSSA